MSSLSQFGDADPLVSICIPTYDSQVPRVKDTLKTLARNTLDVSYEVVLVDCERELRGYTNPQNEAVREARGQFFVTLNDDVLVTPGWLSTLVSTSLLEQAWCTTPDQTHCDGPQIFAPYCALYTQEAWEALGGLDERFVFWCSDIDIARRMVELGHPPVRVKLPRAIHHILNATAVDHPELGEICMGDLQRYRDKWGTDAEQDKHRLVEACSNART